MLLCRYFFVAADGDGAKDLSTFCCGVQGSDVLVCRGAFIEQPPERVEPGQKFTWTCTRQHHAAPRASGVRLLRDVKQSAEHHVQQAQPDTRRRHQSRAEQDKSGIAVAPISIETKSGFEKHTQLEKESKKKPQPNNCESMEALIQQHKSCTAKQPVATAKPAAVAVKPATSRPEPDSESLQNMIDAMQNIVFCLSDASGGLLLETIRIELMKDAALIESFHTHFGTLTRFISEQMNDFVVTKDSAGKSIVMMCAI